MENEMMQIRSATAVETATDAGDESAVRSLQDQIIAMMRTVYDPEIPVNVYDLGLIYRVEISADMDVAIDMTLTTVGCPVAHIMPGQVQTAVAGIPGINSVTVNLVWDPPWTQDKLSDIARLELGLM